MHKIPVHCGIRDETVVSANKPCAAAPFFALYRQPNQHCCIFRNSTAGGERPKRSTQELYNLLRGWQRVISVIQLSYLGLWYPSKYILSPSFNWRPSRSLQHGAVIVAMGSRADYQSSSKYTHTHTRTHGLTWLVTRIWNTGNAHTRTHTHRASKVGSS